METILNVKQQRLASYMRHWIALVLFLLPMAQASGPQVMVTIKPVHSLVAQVMQGVGIPTLLIKHASPHGYSLTPSNRAALDQADLVIWIGPSLETFLTKLNNSASFRKKSLTLEDIKSIKILSYESMELHDGHTHGETDPHLWLSPENAQEIVRAVAARLSALDPAHAHFYGKNATQAIKSLEALDTGIRLMLQPALDQNFIVLHDAYQYFTHHYGLKKPYVLTQNPELPLSAQRVVEVQSIIQKNHITRAFSEPQFPQNKLFAQLASEIQLGELDPLGYDVPSGPQAYGIIMRNLAHALAQGTPAS